MDRLWAPWRRNYILGDRGDGCFLCQKPAEDDDRKNYILERRRTCFTLLNIYPYNNGHLMVAPFKHVASLGDLPEDELLEIILSLQYWQGVLTEASHPDGYNIGLNLGLAAGAGLADHLHAHIVPRWSGDTNFMPVLTDTKVLIEHLDQSYDTILAARDRLEGARPPEIAS